MFQFHLVRLKARHDRAQPERESAFQFHLVRLKETDILYRTLQSQFQFHLVRLKVIIEL